MRIQGERVSTQKEQSKTELEKTAETNIQMYFLLFKRGDVVAKLRVLTACCEDVAVLKYFRISEDDPKIQSKVEVIILGQFLTIFSNEIKAGNYDPVKVGESFIEYLEFIAAHKDYEALFTPQLIFVIRDILILLSKQGLFKFKRIFAGPDYIGRLGAVKIKCKEYLHSMHIK